MTATAQHLTHLNGFDTAAVAAAVEAIGADPALGDARFHAVTEWRGASRVTTRTLPLRLGNDAIERAHVIEGDEPRELFGSDAAANPVELLLSALGSCMTITGAANAAMMGIELRSLSVETHGDLDLRGALGIDPAIRAGLQTIECTVRIDSAAPREQLEELVQSIVLGSPVFDSVSRSIHIAPQLRIA